MPCCRRIEKISWTDRVRNEEVLHSVQKDGNIVYRPKIKWRKVNWIGHIVRRNGFLEHVIEGKMIGRIEVARIGGRRRKQLLDDLKETRRNCKLKEEVLDRTVWRIRFGRSYGSVVRLTTERMNKWISIYINIYIYVCVCVCVNNGSGSVVGTATAYGLDSPGIESRWGGDFPHLSRPALRHTQPPAQWVPGLSLG